MTKMENCHPSNIFDEKFNGNIYFEKKLILYAKIDVIVVNAPKMANIITLQRNAVES